MADPACDHTHALIVLDAQQHTHRHNSTPEGHSMGPYLCPCKSKDSPYTLTHVASF